MNRRNPATPTLLKISLFCLVIWLAALAYPATAAPTTDIPGGTITTDTTWTVAGSPYNVLGSITVNPGATLTVEPGVELRWNNPGHYLWIRAGSQLIANGTAANPIVFSSVTQEAGSWYGIFNDPNSMVELSHCDIGYAGGTARAALYISDSDATIRDCAIHHSKTKGIDLFGATITPTLSNLNIHDNVGIAILQSTVNMEPRYENLLLQDNGEDAVIIPGGSVTGELSFAVIDGKTGENDPIPYRFTGSITVNPGATLTVEPGVELRWNNPGHYLWIRAGSQLIANGTDAAPVVFSSDTQEAGSWYGIFNDPNSLVTLSHCDIGYAGGTARAALYISDSDTTVSDCAIHHSKTKGIDLFGATITPTLSSLNIHDNEGIAILQSTFNMEPIYENLLLQDNGNDAVISSGGTLPSDLTLAVIDGKTGDNDLIPHRFTGSITVNPGATLTVEPGVELRWNNPGHYLWVRGDAQLVANGTAANPVVFSSDTQEAGSWYGIFNDPNSMVELSHCDIGYAGGTARAALYISDSDTTVSDCSIHHSNTKGIDLVGATITPTLSNLNIHDNVGIAILQSTFNMEPLYENLLLQDNGEDAVISPGGTLSSDLTFAVIDGKTGDNDPIPHRFTGSITVNPGGSLIVEPGVELRWNNAGHYLWIRGNAELVANGTTENPVVFSSDTQAAGSWYGIFNDPASTVALSHCDIGYAGGTARAALYISDSDTTVSDCSIHHSNTKGIDLVGATITPTLSNLNIHDNVGIAILQSTFNMEPRYENLLLQDNGDDAVISPGGTLTSDLTFAVIDGKTGDNDPIPHRFTGSITVNPGATLAVEPGVELRWNNAGHYLWIRAGAQLIANGMAANPVVFSSDTQEAGSWRNIYIDPGASAELSDCVIEYAGSSTGALDIRSSDVSVENCTIQHNSASGIYVNNAQPTVKNNVIANNAFGLRNGSPAIEVDASLNYWGHTSGPNHPTTNPDGQGNGVSDGVLFNPWYSSEALVQNDLAVTAVSAATMGAIGEDFSFSYSVKNFADDPLTTDWHDSFYLSTDRQFSIDDQLLGRHLRTEAVAANASYTEQLMIPLAGVVPGDYYLLIVADSRTLIPDENRSNNIGTPESTTAISINTLLFDTPVSGALDAEREAVYQIALPAGADVLFSAEFNPASRLYLRYNALPTRSEYDFIGDAVDTTQQEILLPNAAGGTWYVLATGATAYTLEASNIDFLVQDVSPLVGGDNGSTTLEIAGAGFSAATAVEIRRGGVLISAETTTLSPYALSATFDLNGAALGDYTLTVRDGGNSSDFPDPFVIVAGTPAELVATLRMPVTRPGRPFDASVSYRNGGDSDYPAAILIAKAPANSTVFAPSTQPDEASNTLQFLALPPNNVNGTVPAGYTGRYDFKGNVTATGDSTYELTERTTRPTQAVDFAALGTAIRPINATAQWDSAYVSLTQGAQTYADLLDILIAAAEQSDQLGLSIRSVKELLMFTIDADLHAEAADIRGTLVVDQGGKQTPLSEATVTLTDASSESVAATTWHDGTFALRGLTPGLYDVAVNGFLAPSLASITYSGAAQTGVSIVVADAGSADGIVRKGPSWFDTVPDAIVSVFDSNQQLLSTAETDRWGRFSMTDLPYDEPVSFVATHENFGVSAEFTTTLRVGQAPAQAILYVTEGSTLIGTVTNAADEPLEGAAVAISGVGLEPRSAVSEANGIYRIENVTTGQYVVSAETETLSTQLENVTIDADSTVNLRLAPERAVTFTLQDPSGSPLAGITIKVAYRGVEAGTTNSAGTVTVSGLPSGDATVIIEGLAIQSQFITVGPAESSVLLTVQPRGTLSGSITRPGGTAAPNLVVSLTGTQYGTLTTTTSATGSYQFDGLDNGDYTLMVGDGFDDITQQQFTVTNASLNQTQDVEINYAVVPVIVRDGSNAPVSKAIVSLQRGGKELGYGVTDAAGSVNINLYEAGAYSIIVAADDSGWQQVNGLTFALGAAIAPQTVVLDAAPVRLIITDGNAPVTNGLVSVDNGTTASLHVTDGAGQINIASLPAGSYDVVVQAEGYSAAEASFTHANALTTNTITLSAARTATPNFAPDLLATTTYASSSAPSRHVFSSDSPPTRNAFERELRLPPRPTNGDPDCLDAYERLRAARLNALSAYLGWEETYWNKEKQFSVNGGLVAIRGAKLTADVLKLVYLNRGKGIASMGKSIESTKLAANAARITEIDRVISLMQDYDSLAGQLVELNKNGGTTQEQLFATIDGLKLTTNRLLVLFDANPALKKKLGVAGDVISTLQDAKALYDDVSQALKDEQTMTRNAETFEDQYKKAVNMLSQAEARFEIANTFGLGDCYDNDPDKEPAQPPGGEQRLKHQSVVWRRTSRDPNDLVGPSGTGSERRISAETTLAYTILFENVPTATAPAQLVTIQHTVSRDIDYSSFAFGQFGFGDFDFDVPQGRQFFSARLDMVSELGAVIEYTASFNRTTGVATWQLRALDPETGDLSSDPDAGFLPPNQTSPEGEGYVYFTAELDEDVADGTLITAQADIVFDENDAIVTPIWSNTIGEEFRVFLPLVKKPYLDLPQIDQPAEYEQFGIGTK